MNMKKMGVGLVMGLVAWVVAGQQLNNYPVGLGLGGVVGVVMGVIMSLKKKE